VSEAINAMFRWYQTASVCYAYLSDVTSHNDLKEMAESRWFTRGWTLPELIAPTEVRFYSVAWHFIGTKTDLSRTLCIVTGVEPFFLTGGDLEKASVAKRMSWASKRRTSRAEDIAYCLLGLFNIHMPIIYGEGRNAFRRLQEEIMSKTDDQSLFAWGQLVYSPSRQLADSPPSRWITEGQKSGVEDMPPWEPPLQRQQVLGPFAESPESFESSEDIEPAEEFSRVLQPSKKQSYLLRGGVQLRAVNWDFGYSAVHIDRPGFVASTEAMTAVLFCRRRRWFGSMLVGLDLRAWGYGCFGRTSELVAVDGGAAAWERRNPALGYSLVMRETPLVFLDGDVVFHRAQITLRGESLAVDKIPTTTHFPWDRWGWGGTLLVFQRTHSQQSRSGSETFCFDFDMPNHGRISVIFSRLQRHVPSEDGPLAEPLHVEVALVQDVSGIDTWPAPASAMSIRDMATPKDSWTVEMEADARVLFQILVERRYLDEDGGFIDIVEFYLLDGPQADAMISAVQARAARQGHATQPPPDRTRIQVEAVRPAQGA